MVEHYLLMWLSYEPVEALVQEPLVGEHWTDVANLAYLGTNMVPWPMVATVQPKVEQPTVVADTDNIVIGYYDLRCDPFHDYYDHHGCHHDRG
jgi:hypothetical protein